MKVAILLSNGFEEIEAIAPMDVLRRANINCEYYSIDGIEVEGAHGIKIRANRLLLDSDMSDVDMIVLPGGMPGAKNLAENPQVQQLIKEFDRQNKYIAAICAAPALVLGRSGVVRGRKVTCYPGMEGYLSNSTYCSDIVVVDNNIITSQGPATALPFGFELVKILKGDSSNLEEGMLWNLIK